MKERFVVSVTSPEEIFPARVSTPLFISLILILISTNKLDWHGRYTTDQVVKLTYGVEHRFEENKSGVVLTDLTVIHDNLLFGARARYHATAFDLLLLP